MTGIALILDALLAVTAGALFFGGKTGIARQMAAAPLLTAALDAAFAAQIRPEATPVLSVLLLVLQAAVLAGSVRLMQIDRARARSKARRRQLRRSRAAFEEALDARQARQSARQVCA